MKRFFVLNLLLLYSWHRLLAVLYPEVFSYLRIGMGVEKLIPNYLEQGLLKDLSPGLEKHFKLI